MYQHHLLVAPLHSLVCFSISLRIISCFSRSFAPRSQAPTARQTDVLSHPRSTKTYVDGTPQMPKLFHRSPRQLYYAPWHSSNFEILRELSKHVSCTRLKTPELTLTLTTIHFTVYLSRFSCTSHFLLASASLNSPTQISCNLTHCFSSSNKVLLHLKVWCPNSPHYRSISLLSVDRRWRTRLLWYRYSIPTIHAVPT